MLPGAALFTVFVKGAGFSHAKRALHDEKTNRNQPAENVRRGSENPHP
jgi:hypothetical protein